MDYSDLVDALRRGTASGLEGLQDRIGGLEAARAMAAGAIKAPLAGAARIGTGVWDWMLNKDTKDAAEHADRVAKAVQGFGDDKIQAAMSPAGQQQLAGIGEGLGKVGSWAKENVPGVKQAGAALGSFKAASPLLASIGEGGLELAGGPEVGGVTKAAKAAEVVPRSTKTLRGIVPAGEHDIIESMLGDTGYKKAGGIPREDIDAAVAERARLRSEPSSLPKPAGEMTPEDWAAFGQQHGVNMTLTPSKSLGISDLATKREIEIPGGLEGTFTIPDVLHMKARNIDPTALPQDVHNALMDKFIRTYHRGEQGMDPVDKFNALNFALLSPNAPLTQNEFLAQRLRVRNLDELKALAEQTPEALSAAEQGTGAAARGGMGVKGTADLGNQQQLAYHLLNNPKIFERGEGETMRDVARRVMNQIPGLGPKTSSLGVPWLDLPNANVSAVDLHMIRNFFPRLMEDPQLGGQFSKRIGELVANKVRGFSPETAAHIEGLSPQQLLQMRKDDPHFANALEDAAIDVIGGDAKSNVYRYKDTGALHPDLHPAIAPEKLGYEPTHGIEFNDYYNKVVDYVDESRGTNPALALFPEQWRLWDRYRGRIEPHEMAHPDWRQLPKSSFNEMQDALQAHKDIGYTTSGKEVAAPALPSSMSAADVQKVMAQEVPPPDPKVRRWGEIHAERPSVPWGKLYYGKADPRLLAGVAIGGGGALAASRNPDVREKARKLAAKVRGEDDGQ